MNSYNLVTRNKRWPKIITFLGIIIVIASLIAVFIIRQSYIENLKPVSASQKSQLITIPLGSTVKEIAQILENSGVIKSAWAFEWYVRNNNVRDNLQAGTYTLRTNQSTQEITKIITGGYVATDDVTILPAQRLDQVRKNLIAAGFMEAAVDKALEPSQYEKHPALVDKPRGASLEGYIYPETFKKTATTQPEMIVKSSLDQMQKFLTPELRAGIVRQGLTVHQGVILASIVEQEIGNSDNKQDAEDKKIVAQVFLKRLRDNMALESDATASYGAILDGNRPTLTYESPYNTYKNRGLPPTPVSNVGSSSLAAVAQPSSTDFVYFVAGDDGKTYFSRTLAEHEKLTEEHCKKLCN